MAGKRTPFGKYGGLLQNVLAEDLFATAATAALKAGNVPADLVDTVNIGQVKYEISNCSFVSTLLRS